MENAEEIFQVLEEFSKKKNKVITRELDEYLVFVARTGDPVYQWGLVKHLFKEKFLNVITDFFETSGIDIPHCPNVDVFNYETMKNSLLEKIDAFPAAPFTIQRICELLTSPKKQYSRIDKFMRAFEKNILVVSTREPGPPRQLDSDLDNGDAQDSLVNGSDNNSDYNVDVDMEEMSSWKENSDPLTYAVHNTEGAEQSRDEEYVSQNGPIHRDVMSEDAMEGVRDEPEEEEGEEGRSQESSGHVEELRSADEEETVRDRDVSGDVEVHKDTSEEEEQMEVRIQNAEEEQSGEMQRLGEEEEEEDVVVEEKPSEEGQENISQVAGDVEETSGAVACDEGRAEEEEKDVHVDEEEETVSVEEVSPAAEVKEDPCEEDQERLETTQEEPEAMEEQTPAEETKESPEEQVEVEAPAEEVREDISKEEEGEASPSAAEEGSGEAVAASEPQQEEPKEELCSTEAADASSEAPVEAPESPHGDVCDTVVKETTSEPIQEESS